MDSICPTPIGCLFVSDLHVFNSYWFTSVDTGGKILYYYYIIFFFLDPDPHLASVCVCVLYLFSVSRYELCVCGNICTCVHVSTNLELPPTMGNFKV